MSTYNYSLPHRTTNQSTANKRGNQDAGVHHRACARKFGRSPAARGVGDTSCHPAWRDSGLEWTIVRASWFNQNFSEGEFHELVVGGEVALPADDIAEPFIDVEDIADVVVAALLEDGHSGQVYEVTGPRQLTFTEAIGEIAEASEARGHPTPPDCGNPGRREAPVTELVIR